MSASGAATTRTTWPSSATRQSPPWRIAPRSRNNATPSPATRAVRCRAFRPSSKANRSSASACACGAMRFWTMSIDSKEEIALRERQLRRGLADEELAVGANDVGLRIDVDLRQRIVLLHVALADASRILHRDERFRELELSDRGILERSFRYESHRRRQCLAERAEHRPVMHRLRRWNRRVRVSHGRGGNHAAFEDERRLHAEERRLPQHQLGQLPRLDRTDDITDAL